MLVKYHASEMIMFTLPSLSHAEQQEAVEEIQALMANGMSSGEAIKLVADKIRQRLAAEKNLDE